MNLLCRLGFHRYRDIWRGPLHSGWQEYTCRCTRCEKQIDVLQGRLVRATARSGPMYPDEAVVASAKKHWG